MAEPIPTLTINVDNEKLKETISLYGQLHEIAARYQRNFPGPTPPLNGGAAGGAGAAGGGAGGPGAAGGGNGAGRNNGNQFLNNVNRLANSINKGFGEVNKTIGKTIGMLKGLFESALKWSVRIALIGGGSLFGYDMLARRASQQAMTAQGMNIPTGQMQAAQNVYGSRISGVSGLMQGLARAQSDVNDPLIPFLLNSGIDPKRGAGENLPKFIQAIGELAASYKDSGMAYTMTSTLTGGAVTLEDVNQIMDLYSKGETPGLARQYETTSKQLDMPSEVNSSFQKLITIFDTNSDRMANSFKTWVSDLNGPIGDLANTFTDAVEKFLKGPNGEKVFDTLRKGIETFSAWISNPGFQKDLDAFTTAVTEIVKAIGNAIIYIGNLIGKTDQKEGETDEQYKVRKQKERTDKMAADREKWEITGDSISNFFGNILGKSADPSAKILNQYLTDEPVQKAQATKVRRPASWSNYSQLESQYGLQPNFLSAIEQIESGGNPLAVGPMTKKGQAKGAFQFMDATARDMGLRGGEVFNREKSAEAAAKYFAWLSKKYDGDPLMMAAAYNWGTGNLDKYGLAKMPDETRKYLEKFLPQIGYESDLSRIAQRTGGSQNRVKVDVEVKQTPGSDITAQIAAQIFSPIIIPY